MDEGSTKRKKRKRGTSLIFKTLFPHTTSGDDNAAKISASDDNLVYCDVTNNGIHGDPYGKTKVPSSRGRMSTIFKAVLFDTAMKKRMRGKKSSKPTIGSTNSSSVLDEKTNDQNNVVKVLEADNNSSNDGSNTVSLSPESDASPAASPVVDTGSQVLIERTITSPVGSQTLTERKVTSAVNSTNKKRPLPSGSPIAKQESKPDTLYNSMAARLCLFIVVLVFVSAVLWMSFKTKSPSLDSAMDTSMVIVGDEL